MTTEEFFQQNEPLRDLIVNLEVNMDVLGYPMTKEQQETLMRTNLIMIKQAIQQLLGKKVLK